MACFKDFQSLFPLQMACMAEKLYFSGDPQRPSGPLGRCWVIIWGQRKYTSTPGEPCSTNQAFLVVLISP